MERLDAVPDTHLPDDDDRDTRGRVLLIALVVVALVAIGGVVWLATRGSSVEGERDAAAGQALGLASQVQQACSTGVLRPDDPLCSRASEVQAQPIPGSDGSDGQDGRGITSTDVNPAGHLIVAYTDGTSEDVGRVVGRDGEQGPPGRGIESSDIVDGRLVLTYTDGQRVDLGPVVGRDGEDGQDGADGGDGPAGRGVASVDQVDGRLVVTYTDGSTQDAGPLPQGERGETGSPGPDCPEGYRPVETGPVEGTDGVTYARSITCVDPDSATPPASGDDGDGLGELPG
jgi:hypothetical protein